jgi:5-methylcytosine-specific restriction protein A
MSDRPNSGQRGYGARWRRFRTRYLRQHPTCALCPNPSEVPDHYPRSRKELLAAGVINPDQDQYVRPLCSSCHNRETAKHQPGGWARRPPRRRPKESHPGLLN